MYDVEKLVSLVCELFDAEAEGKKYNLEVRKNKGYSPDVAWTLQRQSTNLG